MRKENRAAIEYSIATVVCTALVGWIVIWFFPDGSGIWASVLFVFMNLLPMIMAFLFSLIRKEVNSAGDFIRLVFLQRESVIAYAAAAAAVLLYYGVSAILGNVAYTGGSLLAVLAYLPWTILQGGLEEVGWRWYLQTHLNIRDNLILKFAVISVVWFVWHLPLYRLPWITSASSDYAVFYLMILGNTFTLGAVKELSKGAVPCIAAHILIDSFAAMVLVQSNVRPIIILVIAEIAASLAAIRFAKKRYA